MSLGGLPALCSWNWWNIKRWGTSQVRVCVPPPGSLLGLPSDGLSPGDGLRPFHTSSLPVKTHASSSSPFWPRGAKTVLLPPSTTFFTILTTVHNLHTSFWTAPLSANSSVPMCPLFLTGQDPYWSDSLLCLYLLNWEAPSTWDNLACPDDELLIKEDQPLWASHLRWWQKLKNRYR